MLGRVVMKEVAVKILHQHILAPMRRWTHEEMFGRTFSDGLDLNVTVNLLLEILT